MFLLLNCLQFADTEEHNCRRARGKKVGRRCSDVGCELKNERAYRVPSRQVVLHLSVETGCFVKVLGSSPVDDGMQLDYCRMH